MSAQRLAPAVRSIGSTTRSAAPSTSFNGAGGSGVLGSIYGGVDYQITQRGVLGTAGRTQLLGFPGLGLGAGAGRTANVNMNTGLGWAALARAGVLANPSTLLYLVGGYAGQNIQTDGFATVRRRVGELLQRSDGERLDRRAGIRDGAVRQLDGQARIPL